MDKPKLTLSVGDKSYEIDLKEILAPKPPVQPKGTGLRWPRNDLRYYIDWTGFSRTPIPARRVAAIIDKQTDKIAKVCALNYTPTRIRSRADFEVKFYRDAKGGTLGFVPLPVNAEFIHLCRGCGDYNYDLEDMGGESDFANVSLHELVHVAGVLHNESDRSSIMYPFYQAGLPEIQELDSWTVQQLLTKYPRALLS